jgi:hypothetical protein
MRVLVCGGRDFDDAGLMNSVLDRLRTEKLFTVLIHGNARGADRIADAWASVRSIPREPYEVPQDEIGKKAGPLRNQRMLDEGNPDLVVAFPGGGGTKDMVRRAVKARVPIHEVKSRRRLVSWQHPRRRDTRSRHCGSSVQCETQTFTALLD